MFEQVLEQSCIHMAWYDALLCPLTSLPNCCKPSKAHEYTGRTARVKDQQPSPLPPKRINLTQESLLDQAHHAPSSGTRLTPQPRTLGRTYTSNPVPLSPLLLLPFELRTHIYELALGGNILNIRRKHGKIGHMRLSSPTTKLYPFMFDGVFKDQPVLGPTQFSTTGLPLLLTCRSIYREAIRLLYASNVFEVSDLTVLIQMVDLPLLLPRRLAEIRHLSVRWVYYGVPRLFPGSDDPPHDWQTWSRFWEIVATQMPGLKKLELRMEYLGRGGEAGVEKDWVKAVMAVRRVKEAVVEIVLRTGPWAGDRCEDVERVVKEAWFQEGKGPSEG
ncbi:MAG: hypothetical protein Q9175_006885 [Cornicularia normoerica]